MSYLRGLPALYYFTVVIGALALWSGDMRGVAIAGVCFLIGTVQYVLGADPEASYPADPYDQSPDDEKLEL